jgi:hypothetical protein
VQPDVAGRFQELKKILNLERIAIGLQARAQPLLAAMWCWKT